MLRPSCARASRGGLREGGRIPRIVAADHLEQQRHVLQGAADGRHVRHRGCRRWRPDRDAPEGGLESDEAAERGRYPDGAPSIGPESDGNQPGGHTRCSPGARAAGREAQVPGVARRAGERAVAHGLGAQLTRGGLAGDASPRQSKPLHRGRVCGSHVLAQEPRAEALAHAAHGDEILHAHGQPRQTPGILTGIQPAVDLVRRAQGTLCVECRVRVQDGIDLLGVPQVTHHDLRGRQCASTHGRHESGGRHPAGILDVHRGESA
jgi:hypothetical protein